MIAGDHVDRLTASTELYKPEMPRSPGEEASGFQAVSPPGSKETWGVRMIP